MAKLVTFPQVQPIWLFDRDSVQVFALLDGEQVLKVVVTAEALETHFGARGFSEGECVGAFLTHREAIEAVAREKILRGNYRRGDEVVLKMEDFPRKTTTTTTPAPQVEHGLRTVMDINIAEDPLLLRGVKEANYVLQQELAKGSVQGAARWDLVRVQPEKALVQLTLTDEETKATASNLFSGADLTNLTYARFSLFRLWDDMLRERGRRQLDAIQDSPR